MYLPRPWSDIKQASENRREILLQDANAICSSCRHFKVNCKGDKWLQVKEQGKKRIKCEKYEKKKT